MSSTGTKSKRNFAKGFPGLITCNSNAMGNILLHFQLKKILKEKLVLQVKKSESLRENKPFKSRNSGHSSDSSSETDPKSGNFIQRIVDTHDLGQHGGKLLLELSSSVFAPTMVVGCICMGTEVY